MPRVARIVHVSDARNLQATIAGAQPGDEIILATGLTVNGPVTLPARSAAGWVTIRSAGPLPPVGTRVGPADTVGMATILAPAGKPAIQTAPGARNYRLVGLHITVAPAVRVARSLVNLGDGGASQSDIISQPQNIVIDRSYIHGSDVLDLRRGVALNSGSSAVIDSTISNVHSKSEDSQAIAGWNGTGPYLIHNNLLEASGENVMFGGADPYISNALPRDITIRNNDVSKPKSWRGTWLVKNLLELKIGQRVLIEGNHFSGNWADGQSGFALNFKSTNQNRTAPWSNTSHITVRNNVFRDTPSGITLAASPDPGATVPASDFAIIGNRFESVGMMDGEPSGALFQLIGYGGALRNVVIEGNTATRDIGRLATTIAFDGEPTLGLAFSNNTVRQGVYGVKGGGTADGADTLSRYAPNVVFTGNTLIGGRRNNYGPHADRNDFPPP